MSILITGSSGFVGLSLKKYLKKKGLEYKTLDRSEYGDLNSISDWSDIFSGVEVVIHLAARVHVMNETSLNPLEDFRKTNVDLTKKIAFEAHKKGVKKFIFLSSIKVNGEGKPDEYKEEDEPCPEDSYGQSKLEAERALVEISKLGNMSIVSIRPPLIYGPKVKANFRSLVNLVEKGVPLPFNGLKGRRSILFVENLSDFILKCIKMDLRKPFNTFLIADEKPLTISELVISIGESMESRVTTFYFPNIFLKFFLFLIGKQGIFNRLNCSLVISSEKAFNEMNWRPPYSTVEGLKKMFSEEKGLCTQEQSV